MLREIMFHPEAEVEIRSANNDSRQQIADIQYFVDNDFDIILVAPNEAESLTPVIKEVYEKGIPVVVFDRGINGDYYTAFQGADNTAIGREAARYVLSHVSDPSKIIEIYGLEGSTPADERHKGFVDEMQVNGNKANITTIYGDWDYNVTLPLITEVMKENRDVDVIYAHNDRMGIAAADAAEELGIRPLIVGIDAAPEIGMRAVSEGKLDATFLYPTGGTLILNTALDILEDKPFERITFLPSSAPVTRDNVDVLLKQNEELNLETRHLEILKGQLDNYWSQHNTQRTVLIGLFIILLLSFIIIFAIIKAIWSHKRHRAVLASQNARLAAQKNELETQKEELLSLNRQLEEATQSKLMFFTNVSHDLRTPITLIAEPVNQLRNSSNLTSQQRSLVDIAAKNVRILKRLINQILDFRKYEYNRLDINLSEVDLGAAVADWLSSFDSLARKRHISLILDAAPDTVVLAVDVEKIERVFFNLVSNAFKYSPDNARIKVECKLEDNNAVIIVSDSGRGIPKDAIVHLFDRFFQVVKDHSNGSGLGLPLAKAFVEMHGGTISVESEEGHGSRFTVTIPVVHVAQEAVPVVKTIGEEDVNIEIGKVEIPEAKIEEGKPVLLVIDDNEDILNLITQLLGNDYNILTASNGREGMKMATRYVPDVIVCDVMMPVMDGLECTRLLKEEVSTSHIPVLMLTACSMDEQRVQGFDSGADGYIAKPFNEEVLRSQLRNLIVNRRRILSLWKDDKLPATIENREMTEDKEEKLRKVASGIDSEFYSRFLELVNKGMSNPDLSVDNLAAELGLARSQFYRKIKALTNFSPVELIRQLRLKQARRLLTTTEMTISEVGYEVGFASAAYFSKCFHDEFGETPSQLRDRLGQ